MDTSSGTTFGNTATYSCDGGHILVGPNTRTCEANGNWSPDAPTCLGELVHVDITVTTCSYGSSSFVYSVIVKVN